jgi:hypothetical protein
VGTLYVSFSFLRAYKIKEDIIDNLNITHGTWQEEKRNRQLLQEHIRTITDVVRKLSRDILVGPTCGIFKENLSNLTAYNVVSAISHTDTVFATSFIDYGISFIAVH